MRTIFITPLLWKQLDRAALRRGEEGQALVLVALVVFGMIGMVGLAIDGGLAYLESNKLQRAADSAALAGVQWIPDNREVADSRAQLAAEGNGVRVACFFNDAEGFNSNYNKRCRRVEEAKLDGATQLAGSSAAPETAVFTFVSDVPKGLGVRYKVTLAKKQQRWFLGVLGFGEFVIRRTATAEYARLVKFGSSFNYFGTFGVLHDPYVRCDLDDLSKCSGLTDTDLNMPGTTWQRYVAMRCEQPNPPSPCVGGFWGHIAGPNLVHTNGDAFNPIKDGTGSVTAGGNGGAAKVTVNSGGSAPQCVHVSDPQTWFVTKVGKDKDDANECKADNGDYPIRNQDYHADSPGQQQGFGYEIAVEVDPKAIWNYTEFNATTGNHTNLNVTIFDGATSELGDDQRFATSDNYQSTGGNYSTHPYSGFKLRNQVTTQASRLNWDKKQFICSPGTTGDHCTTGGTDATPADLATPKRVTDTTALKKYSDVSPDLNNLELTYNDMRTRLTLYYPPNVPSIPSTYSNVGSEANKVASFEMTDMSVRRNRAADTTQEGGGTINNIWQPANIDTPIVKTYTGTRDSNPDDLNDEIGWQRYCYIIFDDVKAFWNNTRNDAGSPTDPFNPNNKPAYNGGTGPDYAWTSGFYTGTGATAPNTAVPQNNRYAYVCPAFRAYDNNTDKYFDVGADIRWNQLKGTPTARYGSLFDNEQRTIQKGILDGASTASLPPTSDIYLNPIVSNTARYNNSLTLETAGRDNTDPREVGVSSVNVVSGTKGTSNVDFAQVVDPVQDCRRSAIGVDGWPLDPMWGHNRLPFNMVYGDPLTNRAFITGTGTIANLITSNGNNPNLVASKKVAGYYTTYYSFHGWRCEWDFDSQYTHNPRQSGLTGAKDLGANPSLSLAVRNKWGPGNKYDQAFVWGHPGLSTVNTVRNSLAGKGVNQERQEILAPNAFAGSFGDQEFGLQPYFHLSNLTWGPGGGDIIPKTQPNGDPYTNSNAPVRGGTYMLHIQVFGGAGANRYSVKAEYENPKIVTATVGAGATAKEMKIVPVPNVYAITAMSLYANNQNRDGVTSQNVIFDMAYIPPENAGTRAVLQLFDAGDVEGDLDIQILSPSGYGPKIVTGGKQKPYNGTTWDWRVETGAPIMTRITVCPFSLKADSLALGAGKGCFTDSSAAGLKDTHKAKEGNQFYNGQWILLSFNIPTNKEYLTWKGACAQQGVPENLCYYFQINYRLTGANVRANDTTTWQLQVQGQPVHLVPDE